MFFNLTNKFDEIAFLEEQIREKEENYQLLIKEILSNESLHETLTGVGIVHKGKIYKKIKKPFNGEGSNNEQVYYLNAQTHIEPVHSCNLDGELEVLKTVFRDLS